MVDTIVVEKINSVIEAYFAKNSSINIVPVKELMPDFINAGIFTKDHRKGLPIRKILNALDKADKLELMPFVYAERNEQNTYWYFIPLNAPKPTTPYKQEENNKESEMSSSAIHKNDQDYVIDLCDKVLGQKAKRQKKFDFLLGDVHKDGKTKTKLPVDAYYEELQLAIEFHEQKSSNPDPNIKRREKITVSGVPRSEQRLRYESRIAKTLPVNGIQLICIESSTFSCDAQNNIIRNEENDIEIVKNELKKYNDGN